MATHPNIQICGSIVSLYHSKFIPPSLCIHVQSVQSVYMCCVPVHADSTIHLKRILYNTAVHNETNKKLHVH